MWWLRWASSPVVHQHGQVEIVGADAGAVRGDEAGRAEAGLHVLAALEEALDPLVEGDGGRAGRAGQALLQAGGGGIDPPGIDGEVHATEGGGGIDIEDAVIPTAHVPYPGQGLGHGGGGVAVHDRHQLGAHALDLGLDGVGLEHGAPRGLHGAQLGAAAGGDLAEQVSEAAEDRHQYTVAGLDQGDQHGLDAGSGGAVDQERPAVGGLVEPAQQRHGLVHIGRELGVELAEQRHRHGAQHARIGVDRPRPQQQARARVEVAEKVWRGGRLGHGRLGGP